MADQDYILTSDEYTRVGRAVRAFETRRRVIPPPGLREPKPIKTAGDARIWHDFRNDSGETIPPRAALRLKVGGTDGTEYNDTTPILVVDKPDADHMHPWQVPINNDSEVEADEYGKCTFDSTWAFVDANFSAIAVQDTLGTVSGEWYLREGMTGFRALSGEYPGVDTDEARVKVIAHNPPHYGALHHGNRTSDGKLVFSTLNQWGVEVDDTNDNMTITRRGAYKIWFAGRARTTASSPVQHSFNVDLYVDGSIYDGCGPFHCLSLTTPSVQTFVSFSYTSHFNTVFNVGQVLDLRLDEITDIELTNCHWHIEEAIREAHIL